MIPPNHRCCNTFSKVSKRKNYRPGLPWIGANRPRFTVPCRRSQCPPKLVKASAVTPQAVCIWRNFALSEGHFVCLWVLISVYQFIPGIEHYVGLSIQKHIVREWSLTLKPGPIAIDRYFPGLWLFKSMHSDLDKLSKLKTELELFEMGWPKLVGGRRTNMGGGRHHGIISRKLIQEGRMAADASAQACQVGGWNHSSPVVCESMI